MQHHYYGLHTPYMDDCGVAPAVPQRKPVGGASYTRRRLGHDDTLAARARSYAPHWALLPSMTPLPSRAVRLSESDQHNSPSSVPHRSSCRSADAYWAKIPQTMRPLGAHCAVTFRFITIYDDAGMSPHEPTLHGATAREDLPSKTPPPPCTSVFLAEQLIANDDGDHLPTADRQQQLQTTTADVFLAESRPRVQ